MLMAPSRQPHCLERLGDTLPSLDTDPLLRMTSDTPSDGDIHDDNGTRRIFVDGFWIRYYEPPEETPANHRALIISLTRRAFHHTEAGINTPGRNLDAARRAHEQETDPDRKRVNAAMLAGALFNRATDIFTSVVDLDRRGVTLSREDGLMRECSACFSEAMELGKQVRHYSGEEGIDELWGEPCKAYTMSIANFYNQRYLKIAQTMRSIEATVDAMRAAFVDEANLQELAPLLHFCLKLIRDGRNLISYMAGARVPMPVSSRNYHLTLERFIKESAPVLRTARPD